VNAEWRLQVVWIVAAGLLGLAVSSVCVGVLRLSRPLFVAPYATLTALFLYAYFRWSGVTLWTEFRRRWTWGLLGSIGISALVVGNVLSQPVSGRQQGLRLALSMAWLGIVYGFADALLLSVMPVLAALQAFTVVGWTRNWAGRLASGAAALCARLWVTLAYHFGFPEYRGATIFAPAIGNSAFTLG